MSLSTTLTSEEINSLVSGETGDPFAVLGAHPVTLKTGPAVIVRALLPGARCVTVLDLDPGKAVNCRLIREEGLFEAVLPGVREITPYRLRVDFGTDHPSTFYDCYSFTPVLSEDDLYLFNQGTHYRIYDRLGAHPLFHQGVSGVLFALWAPSATRVSLVGDFNQWNGLRHQMRSRGSSGVWELFVPHLGPGLLYKFEIRTRDGTLLIKSDPFAFHFETRPKTAAIVEEIEGFPWTDRDWMTQRASRNSLGLPAAIYEVHLGSWRRRRGKETGASQWLTYRKAVDELIPYVKDMGFNYIQFLPLAEHPFDGSWGYQVTGYYAPTSRHGTPHDLMYLVDRCHAEGLGVILDWVPAHFPKDPHGLEYFDGTHLYEHEDPRQGLQRDWDTLIFNYGRNEVRNFLTANALFWLDKYHFDGLRVDAVASMLYLDYSREEGDWIPNRYGGRENLEAIEFIKDLNTKVFELFPGAITIAEESTSWPGVTRPVHLGGLGFMYKWNMGWMHDMLTFMSKDPVHRRFHMDKLTFALLYAFHENFILPLSHDEVVHGKASLLSKMPGDQWQKMANLRLLLGYMYAEPGKKTLFMGAELGQWSEWNHDKALDWDLLQYESHKGLQNFVRDLNRIYCTEPALYELDYDPKGFQWIDFSDTDATVVTFMRKGKDPEEILIFAFNFTPVPRMGYRIGAPVPGSYSELLNSDAVLYGGSNIGVEGGVTAHKVPWHNQPCSLSLNLPPLGMLVLKPVIGGALN
ncbi:MAG: 1,4-alpha-glucan branching protein GlgB [Deltaproteobacteria bacterium]|nr:1,4-alpha-glucan branching protein GlgB [Deltaproteobacteria bacterium]MBW2050095.1 1,4-alpha-glucan branching protein GlgB [Deltaproteobacteria bacterium]MBW2353270.1 1,4-alpha-glucan branching protein GlgB [Deltaproteobacteria bacterium]HDZ90444.1 1,4-alpha-glucan branching protein GlgB [Deltaproteobacteria bacterium]